MKYAFDLILPESTYVEEVPVGSDQDGVIEDILFALDDEPLVLLFVSDWRGGLKIVGEIADWGQRELKGNMRLVIPDNDDDKLMIKFQYERDMLAFKMFWL